MTIPTLSTSLRPLTMDELAELQRQNDCAMVSRNVDRRLSEGAELATEADLLAVIRRQGVRT